MSAQLSWLQVFLLASYAVGMTCGQILFKFASFRVAPDGSLADRLLGLARNPYFLAAIVFYFALSIAWVWILSFTPLSRAYLFVAISFAMTPLLGALVFAEPISLRLIIGLLVIFAGLIIVSE
jgi:drug/metabolite transporter (DMT)-like permease